MRICFLLSFTPNPRMNKRMRALRVKHDISLIYWKRSEKYLWGDVLQDISSEEIAISANNGNPLKRIFPTLKFTEQAIGKLKKHMPDAVYVQNLDMLFVATLYRCFYNSNLKIIYEVADIHALIIQPQKTASKKFLQRCLRKLERCLCKKISLLVTTSQRYYDFYYKKFIDENIYLYIPNVPEKGVFKNYRHKKEGIFTIGFVGAVRFEKQIRLLVQAGEICKINIEIAGSFLDKSVEDFCTTNHVFCHGKYNYEEEIVNLYERLDAVFSVYPTEDQNVAIALPNKLYEAVICGLPIIVAQGTYRSEIVEQYQIGVVVDCNSLDSYVKAFKKLRDDREFYSSIVSKCNEIKEGCYIEKYNSELQKRIEKI